VIELLARLFQFEEESLRVCREVDIWETLFSTAFFSWGSEATGKDKERLMPTIQASVIKLTVQAATLKGNLRNVEQTQRILALLENPTTLPAGCEALALMLQYKGSETCDSLILLDWDGVLLPILQQNTKVKSSQGLNKLLSKIMNNEDILLHALEGKRMMVFLFDTLLDISPEIRNQSLAILLRIVQTAATASGFFFSFSFSFPCCHPKWECSYKNGSVCYHS